MTVQSVKIKIIPAAAGDTKILIFAF